ncbi:gp436 family protein [Oceaniradius stylonematis]|uniref:gp436 family protein n=1 Tax=Oceaniradius stylonematis TaxID=2184161 RepID=UPI00273D132E|nr:DUF1320 domain-containing protein [Oceaniradius stylonematis]MCR9123000.1 DUF1320 domain-containing protein [Phyllobacteriaceae bacterium]
MYATVQDMIDRFGETELIRLSRPEDRTAETVDADRIETVIADATSLIDSYLRNHYALPVQPSVPKPLIRATCILARHDLSQGARMEPTEQMGKDRADTIKWLERVAANQVSLEIDRRNANGHAATGPGARATDRSPTFSAEELERW